ncbi:MAG: stimulus-sensing domain-containing protein [Proteobacteria bacterium]|nr:stimulus-sensing domain-containing protein [Pseudomonadota bacterium]
MSMFEHIKAVFARIRFSALTQRIIVFNAFAFLVLVVGVLWVQTNRGGLVEERIAGIRDQALIVSGALAEYTTDVETRSVDLSTAEPLLRQLIAPTRLRAQIYSNEGLLIADTRFLLARNVVTMDELPPLISNNPVIALFQRTTRSASHLYNQIMGLRPLTDLEPYYEAGQDGRAYHEVVSALSGETGTAVRVDEQGSLVLSVAEPIQRFGPLYGVLVLTTESGDIDDIVASERAALFNVFLVAFGALLLSSLSLAGFIALPIRRLAAAAERVRRGRAGDESIPTFGDRADEIGELAGSLSAMTRALYDRIDAIEHFAADVAHELKNPLTSLKSALDMLKRTDDAEIRKQMLALGHNDLKRIDRLITDISDASRLDAELSRAPSTLVDIGLLLETIGDIYAGMELGRGVRVVFEGVPQTPAIVRGIDERLGQVFRNLVDNAVSFSPKDGTVRITVTVKNGNVCAVVEDEGPGIPKSELEKIFNRFYTARPPEHGFGNNSGLGLAIVRQIVVNHGGRVWAENSRGEDEKNGARFVVELPLTHETS